MEINNNPSTTLVLSRYALMHILAQVKGLEMVDKQEIKDALKICDDKITLEQNAVSTPLSYYK